MAADIEIEIDGRKLTAKPEQMVIQVADAAGIYIPRFCYHKHLTVAANCRMCLVEVEKSPKALPACATPVMPGMKVFTKSPKTIEAQRAVMEFLLINHPLDCPICDQGGECELQDLSMGYGSSHSDYNECKRAVADEDIGPLISTEMTRCILCTRCVRFGAEVAGFRELGVTQRGEHAEIRTCVAQTVTSEISGNIIDLCPVGALTSKPYRFTARAWELDQAPGVSPHDCLGSNIFVHTRYGTVMRVVAREHQAINETWISDRDRFSYTGLYSEDRLKAPMRRVDGRWEVIGWEKAFEILTQRLHETVDAQGADAIGALVSPNSTVEECYLLQKIMRGLGCSNVDHRLRDIDTQDQANMPAFPGLTMPISGLEQCDAVLLIGSNLAKEQPLAATRLRKAALKNAAMCIVNPVDYEFHFPVTAKEITAPQHIPAFLKAMVAALENKTSDANAKAMAAQLQGKQKVTILLGALASHHTQASAIRYYAQRIAALTGAHLGLMTDGANSAGAWLAGAIPHRTAGGVALGQPGLSAYAMLANPRKAYLLLNVEPELDCANASQAVAALAQASFVAAITMYRNATLEAHADLLLPAAAFTETSGSFVNASGDWQHFNGVAKAYHEARPAWKILRVLGNFLHLDGFDYESSEAVKNEVKTLIEHMPVLPMQFQEPAELAQSTASNTWSRIGEIPIYAVDGLTRRAQPLQEAQTLMEGAVDVMRVHPETAKKAGLTAGNTARVKQAQGVAELKIEIDERIARDTVWIAGAITATGTLGDLFGMIELC